MSSGKHTQYAKKILSSEGKAQPLILGGGDGAATAAAASPSTAGPVVLAGGYNTLAAADTLKAAGHAGILVWTGAVGNVTCMTGALLTAAYPDIPIGASWTLTIVAAGTNTVTLVGAAGVVVSGTATVANAVRTMFQFVKTGAATYIVYSLK